MKVSDIKYIDCHSHPHDERYVKEGVDVNKILQDLAADGGATIAIGTDFELSKQALELAKKHANLWCTLGVHPGDNHSEIFDERFENLFLTEKARAEGAGQQCKIVGVGECGLDYYYFDKLPRQNLPNNNANFATPSDEGESQMESEKERQKILFRKQIEFALKYNLPLVIHGRPSKNSMDAYRDMLEILEEYKIKTTSNQELATSNQLRGHAHFFVGNLEIAKRFLDLGFLMSFDGPITFSKEYDEVIKFLPIESIMIETDSPYAAPAPFRGQTNYPIYVKEVAKKIAELKNLSTEEVLEITKNNAIKLFNLNI